MAVGVLMANYQRAEICILSTLSFDSNYNMLCMEMEIFVGTNNVNVAEKI